MIAAESPNRPRSMIDHRTERLVPLKNTTQIGASVHWKTLKRWATKGIVSRVNGALIILDTAFEGCVRCTTREAYIRFLTAYNEPTKPAKRKARR